MHNFATYFWKSFQDSKDNTAFLSLGSDGRREELTYWEWTRGVQRVAIGLLDAGFEAGMRIGIVAPNSQAWLDVAFAAWLIGGCIVPLTPDRERRETLRCLARSGCDWIVVRDEGARLALRGQATALPEHLRWLVLHGDSVENVHTLTKLSEEGRVRLRRGGLNQLAERTYELKPSQPTLMLFAPEPGDDPQGSFFTGAKLGEMLRALGRDLALEEDARLAVLLSYGWLSAPLFTFAALLQGRTILTADTLGELTGSFRDLNPTHIVCGPAYLEGQAGKWMDRIENAPEFIRRLSETGDSPDSRPARGSASATLKRAMSLVGQRTAQKLFYEPMVSEFGGELKAFYVFGGSVPDEIYDVFEQTDIEVLGHFGLPECGVSHLERSGARRRHSVGRPVEGYASKIDGAHAEGSGELLIRSATLFDGYWTGKGPREIDEGGWLHTGVQAHIKSGFLFLE